MKKKFEEKKSKNKNENEKKDELNVRKPKTEKIRLEGP